MISVVLFFTITGGGRDDSCFSCGQFEWAHAPCLQDSWCVSITKGRKTKWYVCMQLRVSVSPNCNWANLVSYYAFLYPADPWRLTIYNFTSPRLQTICAIALFIINFRSKFYRSFCAQHLYSTFPKYYLLRLQLTVSPSTKLRMLSTMMR